MPRCLLVVLLTLAAAMLQAQVAVTSSGYGTQSGSAVPVAVPSPPLMFTPSVHLGEAPTTAYYANGAAATLPGVAYAESESAPPPQTVIVMPAAALSATQPAEKPFNFGMAQYPLRPGTTGSDGNLAELARNVKAQKGSTQAKSFNNSDIQRIEQQWNAIRATGNPAVPNNAPPK